MKILQSSIVPALSLVCLALLSSARATPIESAATQQYTGNSNLVVNAGTVGNLSATNASFGLRFSGTNGGYSNSNIVINYGTIFSGIQKSPLGNAGIAFDASNGGHSSGNVVTNYGTVVAQGEQYFVPSAGVLFNAVENGETNWNIVKNYGSIQASGTLAMGVGFFTEPNTASRANQNTIINNGSITLRSNGDDYGGGAMGIWFETFGGGASLNKITNNGLIDVSGQGATGIQFDGCTLDGNSITNNGMIRTSGRPAGGICLFGDQEANGNVIVNNRSISVSGDGTNTGIAIRTYSGSLNNNVITNTGVVSAAGEGDWVLGIWISGYWGSANGNIVNNYGLVRVSGPAPIGVAIDADEHLGSAVGNIINNYGTIVASGSSSVGIYLWNTTNNVINNWGTITAIGAGSDSAAMRISGNNNVINLNGHSKVVGLISATGTNNVLNLNFTGVSTKTAHQLKTQLMAQNALGGAATSGSFTLRGVTYTYDPLIVNLDVSSYQEQGKTPNQKAIGANLDSFKVDPSGNMLNLLTALDQSGNVAWGLEQLSPQRYQIYGDIALAQANFVTQSIDQRLDNVRLGSESIDTSNLGVSSSSIQSKLGMSDGKGVKACAAMSKDGKSVSLKDTVAPETKRWGAFLSGEVTFADVDGQNWQQNSNFVSSGLLAGVDAKITDSLTSGLLLSYAHTDVDLDSQNSNANVDTYGTGIYGGYREGQYYGNGLFTYARNIYESDRNVEIPSFSKTANGRTAGNQYVFNLDGGYDQPICKDLTVGPFIGLQYVHLDVNSFTENGADAANLAINDQGMDSVRSRLGVRLELRKELSTHWTAASEVRLGWQHEFANNDRAIVARFSDSGLGSFAVRTNDPERDAALVGLGLNATYCETLTTFVDYDVQADPHYTEQIVKGGFKWSF